MAEVGPLVLPAPTSAEIDYADIVSLDDQYADLELALADCAAIVLARRFKTRRLLTFDERHFRTVVPLQGGALKILPTDA
jgi:uncharacterized protein